MKMVIFFFFFLSSSCGSSTLEKKHSGGVLRPMMGLHSKPTLPEHWKKWTPKRKSDLSVLFEKSSVFDYWRVEDREEIEFIWSVFSTVIVGLGSELEDEEMGLSIRSTLALLEPGAAPEERTLSFTFLTRKVSEKMEEAREGMLIRWSRKTSSGALVSASLLMSRRGESRSDHFDEVRVWIEPGFSEIPSLSFTMKKGQNWRYRTQKVLVFEVGTGKERVGDRYIDAIHATLWRAYTGSKYIEYDKMLKGGFPSEIGEPKLREVDLVFRRTQFPPRFDFRIKRIHF